MEMTQGGDDRHFHVTQTCKCCNHPHRPCGALLTCPSWHFVGTQLYINKIIVGQIQTLKGSDCLVFRQGSMSKPHGDTWFEGWKDVWMVTTNEINQTVYVRNYRILILSKIVLYLFFYRLYIFQWLHIPQLHFISLCDITYFKLYIIFFFTLRWTWASISNNFRTWSSIKFNNTGINQNTNCVHLKKRSL